MNRTRRTGRRHNAAPIRQLQLREPEVSGSDRGQLGILQHDGDGTSSPRAEVDLHIAAGLRQVAEALEHHDLVEAALENRRLPLDPEKANRSERMRRWCHRR